MDRSENIEKLAGLLSADEYGDIIAETLVEILAEERKRNIFVIKLQDLKNEVRTIDRKITFTPMEQSVLDFVIAMKQPLNASEVSKGVLGKIKIGHSYYFTSPDEAVRESLKKRGEEPDRCSPVRIGDETGLPLAVVLEVIGGLLG